MGEIPSMEPMIVSRPNLAIKIEASPWPSTSESGTALFFIRVSYTHRYVRNGRIRTVRREGPRETISFRFNHCLDLSQLRTVADRISSLTGVRDPLFFNERFLGSIFGYCNRATLTYYEHRMEFLVSVESRGPAAPTGPAASYVDDVLIIDLDVQGGGTPRSFNLERIKDVTLERRLASDQCPICLEELGPGKGLDLGKTPCSHVFHYRCVKGWLERKRTCPLCRSDLSG